MPIPRTVLVIDDDYQLLRALQRVHMAKQPGWELAAITDPSQAFELLEEEDLALLVTDLVMPEIEGLSIIAGARQRAPNLPIVAITGKDRDDPHVLAAIELGILGFLQKPFSAEEFLTFVDCHLPTKKLE